MLLGRLAYYLSEFVRDAHRLESSAPTNHWVDDPSGSFNAARTVLDLPFFCSPGIAKWFRAEVIYEEDSNARSRPRIGTPYLFPRLGFRMLVLHSRVSDSMYCSDILSGYCLDTQMRVRVLRTEERTLYPNIPANTPVTLSPPLSAPLCRGRAFNARSRSQYLDQDHVRRSPHAGGRLDARAPSAPEGGPHANRAHRSRE
jgi:hypothetical protein